MGTARFLAQSFSQFTDEEVVDRLRSGDTASYEILMRRYNQRLYRIARAVLRDDSEAEDVMQETYVRAYQNLHQFEGRAPFSAWLTRIAVREAQARLRKRHRSEPLDDAAFTGELSMKITGTLPTPEQTASTAELAHLLEEALLELPESYREVLVLRDVEDLSTAETAAALDLTEQNVKVRLHRGRAMARGWLLERVGSHARSAFPFLAPRCDRVVASVLLRLLRG